MGAAASGEPPPHVASMAGHVDLARRLLAAGASRDGRLYGAVGGTPRSAAPSIDSSITAR